MTISKLVTKKIDGFWFVTDDGTPFGRSRDFYSESTKLPISVSRNPFPFRKLQNKFATEKEAEEQLQNLKNHMRAVIQMEDKQKVGSSRWWSE